MFVLTSVTISYDDVHLDHDLAHMKAGSCRLGIMSAARQLRSEPRASAS